MLECFFFPCTCRTTHCVAMEIFIGAVRVGMIEKEVIVNPSRPKVCALTVLLESITCVLSGVQEVKCDSCSD